MSPRAAGPPGTPPEPTLRLSGLTRRFGNLIAVDAVSLEIRSGELFGLVGPDGAGKTTTLRMLAGVLKPSVGDATLWGVSVAREPERSKPHIAYMPQRFGLYADLTVLENLQFYADLFGVPPAERAGRMERLFRFSDLGRFADRRVGQLSGGMKQKLGLSCALIHKPRLLLLDEPTFGVDPVSRRDLWLIVHEMVAEGVTAVVSTSYMDEAERFDRVALLDQGRLLAVDRPELLEERLRDRLLEIRVDRIREARDAALADARVRAAVAFGDRLHLTVASASRDGEDIARGLRDAGFHVASVGPVDAGMEDVFLDALGRDRR